MLVFSLVLVGLAAVLGVVVIMLHLLFKGGRWPFWMFGAVHGLFGTAGVAALLLALRGPARGEQMGAGSFGRVSAILLVVALLAGLGILSTRLRRRSVPGLVIGLHATLAIAGFVMLAAYVAVPT